MVYIVVLLVGGLVGKYNFLGPDIYAPCIIYRWYPPGHGDIYASLKRSGLLDEFIEEGREIMFISNIDNLGATVDLSKYFDRLPFLLLTFNIIFLI